MPGSSTHYFHKKVRDDIPEDVRPALNPIVEMIGEISNRIDHFDKFIKKQCETKHAETILLSQVHGVGALTALAFVLVLEEPRRFQSSRTVGCFLGLPPRSGEFGFNKRSRRGSRGRSLYSLTLEEHASSYLTPCPLNRGRSTCS